MYESYTKDPVDNFLDDDFTKFPTWKFSEWDFVSSCMMYPLQIIYQTKENLAC